MLNIIKNTINRVFASGVDSDASAFITATGLSGTTQKSAIITLVKDLKASGLWSKMKAIYPFVTDKFNMLSYTEDFTNAYWNKTGTTVSPNTTVDPNGGNTADTLVETTSSNEHYTNGTLTKSASSLTYTASVYFKNAIGTRNFGIGITNGLTAGKGAIFSTNGTVVSSSYNIGSGAGFSVISTSIQDAGSGWYRAIFTITTDASTRVDFVSYIVNGTTTSYVGNGTSGIYIWGSQLEQSSTASTYQPVLGSQQALIASQMKYNLKDARDLDAAFRLTWSGGWTYSATGATPNGTNAFANTYFIPSANLSATSQSSSIYSRTNSNYGISANVDFSSVSAGGSFSLITGLNFASIYGFTRYGLNQDIRIITPANRQDGFFIGTRTSSTSLKLWRFNSLLGTTTTAETGISTVAPVIGAENNNGVISNYTNRQYAFASMSDGLSDQDALLFGQIVEKYQVALSRGVQAAQSFYYNSAYSNEANTYLYSTQITGTTQVSAINTLINGLKANNLWTKMKAVYPFVTDYRNLLAYTENFSNAVWGASSTTITVNDRLSPTGTLTADKFVGTVNSTNPSTNNGSLVYYVSNTNPTIAASNNTVTGSVYIYATSAINVQLFLFEWGGSAYSQNFTLTPNTWQRISSTATFSGGSGNVGLTIQCNANTVWCWGAQLELGSNLYAYQPVLAANNYATNVAAQMKFNLVNPQDSDAAFRLAFSGGWTYSTNGALPNGTNGYADTKLNPSTVLSANNIHLSYYSRTNSAVASSSTMGADSAIDNLRLIIRRTSDIAFAIIGNATKGLSQFLVTDSRGLFVANAPNSTTRELYKNSTSLTPTSQSGLGLNGTPNANLYLSAYNNNGVVFEYDNKQCAFSSIGEGLSSAEVSLLNQLVTEYQTTLSRNV